jgi:hypothetical protein
VWIVDVKGGILTGLLVPGVKNTNPTPDAPRVADGTITAGPYQ